MLSVLSRAPAPRRAERRPASTTPYPAAARAAVPLRPAVLAAARPRRLRLDPPALAPAPRRRAALARASRRDAP